MQSGQLGSETFSITGTNVYTDAPTSIQDSTYTSALPLLTDPVGNITSDSLSTYTYSSRDHLTSGDGIQYQYDGFGRRVSAAGPSGTRNSVYDDSAHLVEESSLTGTAAAYDYIWFNGEPVAQENIGSTTQWNALNHLGAPFMQTGSTGAVTWQADYAPYGGIYDLRTADAHQPLRLPGQEAEEFTTGNPNGATNRCYNGARWYYPSWGMYTQPDPLKVQNPPTIRISTEIKIRTTRLTQAAWL